MRTPDAKRYRLHDLRTLGRWLGRTWQRHRLQATLNTAVGLVAVAADLAFVWATKLCVDIATGVETRLTLTSGLAILAGITVLQLSLGVCVKWIRATLGVEAACRMQRDLLERLLHADWTSVRKFHSGHLLNRLERDTQDITNFLTEQIPQFISTCVQFAGAFLFLFFMDRTLAVIVVLVVPFFVVASRLYIRKMRTLSHEIRETESRIQASLQEDLQHSLVIRILERVGLVVSKVEAQQRSLRGLVVRRTCYATVSSTVMNAGFACGYLITFGWGAFQLQQQLITYGALIAFIQLVGQIQGPVRTLTRFVPVFIGTFTAAERLMELESLPGEPDGRKGPPARRAGIAVRDVTFRYADQSRLILDHLSHYFAPGSVTAIVGETGAGKTTLIRLLLALIRPESGSIRLTDESGTPIAPVDAASRNHFSYVPQGNTLLSGTIRENLLLGDPSADEERLNAALHTAAADFVFALPEGIDTPLGEVGGGLSEGQAQRIAIARALLKESPVLLLDEATSSLDAETERTVLGRIVEYCKGRTLIFITHRPEVLRHATDTLRLARPGQASQSDPEC